MNGKRSSFFICMVLTLSSFSGFCQETVFSLLKTDVRLADEYYAERNYQKALTLYWNVYRKNASAGNLRIKIARCYYFLKEYKQAVSVFESLMRSNSRWSSTDLYYYAESLASAGNYRKAMDAYRAYLKQSPGDTLVAQKLWRLDNVQYLYEDSIHYAVRRVPLNSDASELCAIPYKNGVVFVSNREEVELVEKVDASSAPLYKAYFATASADSLSHGGVRYGKPVAFNKYMGAKLQAGPVAFYSAGKKMVFAASGDSPGLNGHRTLQLYFAAEKQGSWKTTEPFPYNSSQYSLTDPTISSDGTVLYFSSDMKGGIGGKDLYRSEYTNGKWQKPENLGAGINTQHDEVFPFIHQNKTLYFSSNGHAGLGGLDIFKTQRLGEQWDEVTNAGYPLNSNADEFGFQVDSLSTRGYFSSNRKNSGLDDDLYQFDMDLQTYPLEISGLIRMKEHSWSDSSELRPLANVRIFLIDNVRDVSVCENISDEHGNFSIVIPYFSKYKIRVIGVDGEEHIVSLEIPKHRKVYSKHDVVIVKDLFRASSENLKIK